MARGGRSSRSSDVIYGTNGDDILLGIGGSFNLIGGKGNDTYTVDDDGDKVVEKKDSGTDHVISYVDFVLGDHVENLTLAGADDLSGTGNDSDNIITGNSGDNTLQGLGGDDTLDGGDGTDTAVFAGLYSDYVIEREGTDLRVTYKITGEIDILRNIEFLSFSDIVIAETAIAETGSGDETAPLAVADTAAGDEDNAVVIAVLANDSGEGLTIASVANGGFGLVAANANGTVTYTPDANANGQDSFSYTVTDALGRTSTTQVVVDIYSVNDAPIAVADGYSAIGGVDFSSPGSVLDNDSDPDGDQLTVTAYDATSQANGSVLMNTADGTFTYTAASGFVGTDSFTYTLSDGNGGQATATVSIDVAGGNSAPIAVNDTYLAVSGEVFVSGSSVLDNDSDPDGDNLTITAYDVTSTGGGSVTMSTTGTFTYTAAAGFIGTDSFSYTLSDGNGGQATATVSIDVAGGNSAPIAVNDTYLAVSGEIFVSGASVLDNDSDPDGDNLTITAYEATSQSGGSVQMNADGTFTYTAASGFVGTDSFSYTVGDGNGGQATATATVTVEPADALPYYIEALLADHEAKRLNYPDEYGTGTTVTYTFLDAVPDYYSATDQIHDTFRAFSEQQEQIARDALALIESFTDLTFVEVASADAATITFGLYDLGGDTLGVGRYPIGNQVGTDRSDLWIDTDLAGDTFITGTEAYYVLLHEIGHVIGLSHPALPISEDNRQYTVMDYQPHKTMSGDVTGYQLYDIAALQYIYGTNTSYATGNDVYGFSALDGVITTIWDAAGYDVIDMSAATYAVDLDLTEGAFSTVAATGSNNVAIAFGTVIEDAIGSDYNDSIAGNDAANRLSGGGGDDVLTGRGGLDVFAFTVNWGNDTITDYIQGEDQLDFSEAGLTFAKLDINSSAGNTVISHGENSVTLQGVEAINENEFTLA